MKNNICVVIPYYGKWPVFFDLFLKSCSFNADLHVLFITDLNLPISTPSNVRRVNMTFEHLSNLAKQKLGIEISLESYYKLCDFKPMYGYIFSEYLSNYRFWAFGDIDLIYGEVRKFITHDVLDNYDVITFREEWLSGALTLFRNAEYTNMLFKLSPDWQRVAMDGKHFSFTECAGQYDAIKGGTPILELKADIVSMTAVCRKEELEGRLKIFSKKIIRESIVKGMFIRFDQGLVSDSSGTEYLLYHYISDKPRPYFVFPKWKVIPDNFYINRFGFYLPRAIKFQFLNNWWRVWKNREQLIKTRRKRK